MAVLTDIALWRFHLPLDKPSRVTHHASARAAAVHSGIGCGSRAASNLLSLPRGRLHEACQSGLIPCCAGKLNVLSHAGCNLRFDVKRKSFHLSQRESTDLSQDSERNHLLAGLRSDCQLGESRRCREESGGTHYEFPTSKPPNVEHECERPW